MVIARADDFQGRACGSAKATSCLVSDPAVTGASAGRVILGIEVAAPDRSVVSLTTTAACT